MICTHLELVMPVYVNAELGPAGVHGERTFALHDASQYNTRRVRSDLLGNTLPPPWSDRGSTWRRQISPRPREKSHSARPLPVFVLPRISQTTVELSFNSTIIIVYTCHTCTRAKYALCKNFISTLPPVRPH